MRTAGVVPEMLDFNKIRGMGGVSDAVDGPDDSGWSIPRWDSGRDSGDSI